MQRDQDTTEPFLNLGPDGRAFNKDGAFVEYQARVQGIASTDAGIIQFTGIILAAVSGITAAGITAKDQYLFLVDFGLLIAANLYIAEKRWVIWLHAAYLRKYLENDRTGIWWETRLFELRKGAQSPVGGIKWVELLMFITIGIIEAGLFLWYDRAALKNDSQRLSVATLRDLALHDHLTILAHFISFLLFLALLLFAVRNYRALETDKALKDIMVALPGVSRR